LAAAAWRQRGRGGGSGSVAAAAAAWLWRAAWQRWRQLGSSTATAAAAFKPTPLVYFYVWDFCTIATLSLFRPKLIVESNFGRSGCCDGNEKRDAGGGCALQQIHSLFRTKYSILE
jgi:hypothetical protein